MMQRFANTHAKSKLAVEHPAELMYVCKAEPDHTQMPRAMHMHDDRIEIVFIRDGSGAHIIGGRLYHTRKGDVLIYNRGVLHDESTNPNAQMSTYCCGFKGLKLNGLPRNTLSRPNAPVVLPSGELFGEFECLCEMLYQRVEDNAHYNAEFCNQLLQALVLLVCRLLREQGTVDEATGYDLGEQIKRYIDEHYLESIDLKTMAQKLHLSQYYLAHTFKNSIGCSPRQYLIRRRIGEAQSLLINTDLSVTEIATRVGYEDSNYFNTAFKKVVGITPNGYRKQCVK